MRSLWFRFLQKQRSMKRQLRDLRRRADILLYQRSEAWRGLPSPPLTDSQAETVAPLFFLSTGRAGTMWIARQLKQSNALLVHHEPRPRLFQTSTTAYQHGLEQSERYGELVRSARDDHLAQAHAIGRTYVETNNRLTFLAPALAAAYPQSRFVLVHRHPGDFVRSAMRRGYFRGISKYDHTRISPVSLDAWETMPAFEKCCWLWNETYAWSERFLETLSPERVARVGAEKLWAEPTAINAIWDLLGVEPEPLARDAGRRNEQSTGAFPRFTEWSDEQRETLWSFCPLAREYGYLDE